MTLDLLTDPEAPDDAHLLRDYAHTASNQAFATLVHRYADLVYSAARRQVRDPHLAEDVAQAVFILLSQRAGKIRDPARLVGWLYQTTHFTANNAKKLQRRRERHEQAFAAQEQTMTLDPHDDDWSEIAPVPRSGDGPARSHQPRPPPHPLFPKQDRPGSRIRRRPFPRCRPEAAFSPARFPRKTPHLPHPQRRRLCPS